MSKRKRVRKTLLKIRATPLVRMPKSRFFYLIKKACETGRVPEEIEISTLNWDHRVGRKYQSGAELNAADAEELRNCYGYLTNAVGKQDVRVERPDS